jgi:hypothetical protein
MWRWVKTYELTICGGVYMYIYIYVYIYIHQSAIVRIPRYQGFEGFDP